MKTALYIALLTVLAINANGQSELDRLAIAPDRWRLAIARLGIESDTLKCSTTKTKLYQSGEYGDRITYEVKGKCFDFSQAEILLWCAKKEDEITKTTQDNEP